MKKKYPALQLFRLPSLKHLLLLDASTSVSRIRLHKIQMYLIVESIRFASQAAHSCVHIVNITNSNLAVHQNKRIAMKRTGKKGRRNR